MVIQFSLIGIFALNLLFIWFTILTKRLEWYRILGVFIWLAVLIAMPIFPQPRFYLDFMVWRWAGAVAILLGLGIALWAILELLKVGILPQGRPQQLVTTGPYAYIRHPIYLGSIFMLVGWCWVWAAVYSFYFGLMILALHWVQAYLEEKFILEPRFGASFQNHRAVTGMFWIR